MGWVQFLSDKCLPSALFGGLRRGFVGPPRQAFVALIKTLGFRLTGLDQRGGMVLLS